MGASAKALGNETVPDVAEPMLTARRVQVASDVGSAWGVTATYPTDSVPCVPIGFVRRYVSNEKAPTDRTFAAAAFVSPFVWICARTMGFWAKASRNGTAT